MNACGVGRLVLLPNADVAGDAAQLPGQILPLADTQIVQELLAAHPPKRVAGTLLSLLPQIAPQVQVRQEVGILVGETGVLLTGGLLLVRGPLARIRDRQRGRQHEHFAHTVLGFGRHDHPGQTRIDRQLCEPAAERRYRGLAVEGAELLQKLHAVADASLLRRIEKREALHVTEAKRRHLQDHRGEVGPQDFGIGVAGSCREVVLGVEPNAYAGRDAAGAAGPLGGRRLRDRFNGQPLHLRPAAVAGDSGGAGVDDVPDSRHGQRRLGDVGGQYDAAAGVRGEHSLLFCCRQPCVERQHLGVLQMTQSFCGVADLALARQEDQDVAWRFHPRARRRHR